MTIPTFYQPSHSFLVLPDGTQRNVKSFDGRAFISICEIINITKIEMLFNKDVLIREALIQSNQLLKVERIFEYWYMGNTCILIRNHLIITSRFMGERGSNIPSFCVA